MRTSPVYYIAPSSISIIPNCNGTTSDLAVTIARGTKLKVYYPSIFALGTVDGNYQEWTLAGRNRRLADSTAPYTIYARLRMAEDPTSAASAHANGYLIFAKQTKDAEGNWIDPYILSPNPSPTSPLNNVMGANGKKYSWPPIPAGQAQNGRTGYWWLKLGVVSVPENGKRTVTLDTGILDTAQYNEEWKVNPDDLPVRPVRDIQVDRKEWTTSPKDTYTGETGSTAPDGTLDMDVASKLGWTGTEVLSFTQGQEIDEPYHYRSLTRNRWLTQRLDIRNSGYNDKELYERLTSPARGWEEENWVETSRVWHNSSLWECQKEGTTDEPSEDSAEWRLLMRGGADGEDGDSGYSVELTKSSDSAIIDPSGNVVGGYRTVSIGKDDNGLPKEFYSYRFFTSAAVMKGGEYLHLCGAMDDDEELGEGNFTIEAIGAGCDLKMEGTTCYITGIWHCNDGNAETPNTSYSENPEEYQLMRAMTECVAHITLNIEGKTAVTKDYRLQLVHLPTDTVVIESHNEVAAVNWSTKKNAWTNPDSIVIPLTASSGGQPVRFQTVNGEEGPDIRILNKPTWLEGFSLAWADYKDGTGNVLYPASQHMAVEITIPIANIKKNDDIKTSNLLRFNVVTTVDGVEYENIVPFTLNMTTDKAVYVLVPSVRQVVGTMIGGTWDEQAKDVANARYSYTANGASCNNVSCRLMSYDENNALTEITNASDIHDNVTFLLNGQPSSLAAFRAGLSNTAVAGKDHNLFDELSEIVFAIRLDDNDYESEGVPILRNGAQLTVGSDGYWYIGGVKTEVFAKGTEVTDTKIYYTDPMTGSTPPPYSPEDDQRGLPVSPYLKTECPAAVEGKFIHYVSITVFSDSDKTFVYSYGTIGTGNTITVIHDRDYYASSSELKEAQLKAIEEWSESTPADYSATNKYLYSRDTARYYKNGAEQIVTVGGIAYPKTVYTLLSYWGQDGSGVEFAYYRADDDSAANKPSVSVLNQRHPGTAKNPVIADWSGSDGGWYDDNPGFTTQGQVMYQSVNKYSNGQWSGWEDPVIIDRYAQNSVRLDIDNEVDMVPTDSTGKITAARTVSTVVHLYDGTKEVDISAATLTISGTPASTVATQSVAASGNGKKLSWDFKAGQTMADTYNISIAYTYNSTAYTATFTVSASKGQAVWQLKPSMSAIPFQRNADNTLTPASRAVGLSLVKIDGGSTATYTSVQTGLTVRYSTSSMPSSASAGTGWSSGNITVDNTADNLYIALFNASGVLLDRETIPVVKDGENGKSITKKSESYRYATNNTGTRPAASSSDWKTTKPTLQKGYWLYTETTITWSDNSTTVLYTDERNPNDGVAGQDIIVDGSTEMKYYVGDSNTTHPAESSLDWKDLSQVTQTQGKWLWSKATTYYRKSSSAEGSHDGGKSVNYNVSYISKDGAAGRAVTGITEYYKATSSNAEMPVPTSDTGWSTNPNVSNWGATDKYLWNYEKLTYSSGTTVERTKPQIVAIWTKDGKGIDSITNYYKITSSATAPSKPSIDGGDGWDDDPTAPGAGEYLWNYEKVTYTDGTYFRSDVQLIGHVGEDGKDAKYIYIRGTGRNNDAQRILNITSTTNVFSEYGSRGFVAARINRSTLAVSGITWFDVYGGLSEGSWTESDANANTARTRFVTYLANTTSDYFLAVASQDAIGLNDAMVAKLREFGLGKLDYTAVSGVSGFRTPFAFLGYKGLQQGYALYQLQGTGENDPYAEVMAYVSNGIFMSSKDGDDSLSLELDTYAITFPTDSNGVVASALSYPVGVRMYLGSRDNQQTITNISATSDDGDVLVTRTTGGIRIDIGESNFSNTITVTLVVSCALGSRTAKIYLTPAPKGGKGDQGDAGRFFYYAQEWSNNPNVSYAVTDAEAPYFKYNDNYWVFNPANNGTYTMSAMGTPSSSNENWELMVTDFKYLITEAIFGAYAHLGSFIINKDWMLSQYGVLVDSSGTETKVDGGGANPIVLHGNDVHSGTIIVRVQFTTSGTASITATASSEGTYDKGYVKKSDGSTLIEVSGTQSNTVNQSVSSGGYIDLSYTKDGSVSRNDDKITFNISGVGYTLSLVSAASGMTYTGSSSSGGVIPSNPYTYFDHTDPMASTPPSSGYKFRPNFAVDGLTGKTYQNDAYVRGEITATGGSITGTLNVTGGLDVKNSGGSTIVQVNGGDSSKTATDAKTIVDAEGFYVKRGNQGFRLTTSGFQRWNGDYGWVNFFGGRFLKVKILEETGTYKYYVSLLDDVIIAEATIDNTTLCLPSSTSMDGKVLTILNVGNYGIRIYGNGRTIHGAGAYSEITLSPRDRLELIYMHNLWYANYMPKVDNG